MDTAGNVYHYCTVYMDPPLPTGYPLQTEPSVPAAPLLPPQLVPEVTREEFDELKRQFEVFKKRLKGGTDTP